jgi:hypothetical protein
MVPGLSFGPVRVSTRLVSQSAERREELRPPEQDPTTATPVPLEFYNKDPISEKLEEARTQRFQPA